jgi:hypothetical protein
VAESRQMAADARARIFVIFLDTYHTRFANAARMRAPLQQSSIGWWGRTIWWG